MQSNIGFNMVLQRQLQYGLARTLPGYATSSPHSSRQGCRSRHQTPCNTLHYFLDSLLPPRPAQTSCSRSQAVRPVAALANKSSSAKGASSDGFEQFAAVSAADQPIQRLTKARKKSKATSKGSAGNGLQRAGKVAGYTALAVGAGMAAAVFAGPEAAAAVATAALAAGGARSLLGARAVGFETTHVTNSISNASQLRARPNQPKSSLQTSAPDMNASDQSDLPAGLVAQWDDEEELEDDDQGMTDAQWAAVAAMIEQQPCQVSMDGARQFAQSFDPSQRLSGQIVESQQGSVLTLTVQQDSAATTGETTPQHGLNNIVDQAKRREKQKRKDMKRKRKRK